VADLHGAGGRPPPASSVGSDVTWADSTLSVRESTQRLNEPAHRSPAHESLTMTRNASDEWSVHRQAFPRKRFGAALAGTAGVAVRPAGSVPKRGVVAR